MQSSTSLTTGALATTDEEFGEADLTNPPDAMPSFDFGEWDDDSDLEDDPKPSPDQENHPVER
jgi:hypothetical protein